jgi:hypothetical protein
MGTRQSITVSLDMRMPLEALILHRLQRLPVCRHEEWVRQLVLAGFRNECQVMKADTIPRSLKGVGNHTNPPSTPSLDQTSQPPRSSEVASDNTSKPFAHLKRVMGDG